MLGPIYLDCDRDPIEMTAGEQENDLGDSIDT